MHINRRLTLKIELQHVLAHILYINMQIQWFIYIINRLI